MAAEQPNAELYLICRSAGHLCALPLDRVREIMRPLPLERVAGGVADPAASFVLGAAIVRGAVVPVVSLAGLMGRRNTGDIGEVGNPDQSASQARYVSLRLGARHAALAVDAVLGIRALAAIDASAPMAPLIGMVEHAAVAAITTHDAEMLFVLQAARLIPDAAWAALSATGDAEAP